MSNSEQMKQIVEIPNIFTGVAGACQREYRRNLHSEHYFIYIKQSA